jgi:polar amino acid transport system permease protein
MSAPEALRLLATWTPYLLGGFVWNIVISLAAQAIGTAVGYVLARGRTSARASGRRSAGFVTTLMRNIPTFVFQFYLVFMLPDALTMPFGLPAVVFPSWLKASLALSLAVAGFVSDNLAPVLELRGVKRRRMLMRFVLNASNYFVIIVMASSTASVIGVSELVSRCNTVVNASGTTDMMLWVYLYAMLWFFAFCICSSGLIRVLFRRGAGRRDAALTLSGQDA